jgi:aminobenzoyl-glutamate transport protein
MNRPPASSASPARWTDRALGLVEHVGNRLPDTVFLFLLALFATWGLSWGLAGVDFGLTDPRTQQPLVIVNQLETASLTVFLTRMVEVFTAFPPLGLVLVALLGVGVAERTGLIGAALRAFLSVTPRFLVVPMVVMAGMLSHTAADAGYVLVVPLGAAIYHAAGRHPLAGVAAAFAGVGAGFAANLVPSSIDPLLQGFTQSAARIVDPAYEVNPLCNWTFLAVSSVWITLVAWFVGTRLVEPRFAAVAVDGDGTSEGERQAAPVDGGLAPREKLGLALAALVGLLAVVGLVLWARDPGSSLRGPKGGLTESAAPLMKSIVPLIFLGTFVPGVVYGYVSGSAKNHREIVKGMSQAMSSMGYYLVMAFFAAQFLDAFAKSNLGALIALEGASLLQALALPRAFTVLAAVLLATAINLLIASSSAKWALLSGILVPMLMQVGIAPELTQAAYRIGDSCTNAVTPMNYYFPLVVVVAQRYVKSAGIGTVASAMLPYSLAFLVAWCALLLAFWGLDLPLGVASRYVIPTGN